MVVLLIVCVSFERRLVGIKVSDRHIPIVRVASAASLLPTQRVSCPALASGPGLAMGRRNAPKTEVVAEVAAKAPVLFDMPYVFFCCCCECDAVREDMQTQYWFPEFTIFDVF